MSGLHLVTGGGRGIGAAIAEALAAPGRTIGINYRSDDAAARATAARVESKGAKALLLKADATDAAAVDALFDGLPAEPLETLVLNAGVPYRYARLHELTPDEFDAQWRGQARSAFLFCRRAVPAMAKRKAGRIVFVLTSALEDAPPAYMGGYLSAKHALWGLAKAVEAEAAPRGVSVRCVFPGMTKTDFIKDFPRPIVDAAAPIEPAAVARTVLAVLGEAR